MKIKKRAVLGGAVLALIGSAALAAMKPSIRDLSPGPIEVGAVPIASFQKVDIGAKAFGKLEWRGGLVLTSPAKNFGGWSGLVLDPDGRKLMAVSDAGAWMKAEIAYSGDAPSGLKGVTLGPLKALDQRNLRRDRDRDAEAIALSTGTLDNGELLISFEQNARIGRFAVAGGSVSPPSSYAKVADAAKRMKRNAGFEAMTVMTGGPWKGSIIAIAERFIGADGHHTGWLWVKGEPQAFSVTDDGYEVTDVASLADGGLIVLERRFRWLEGVKMRIRRFDAASLKPGAVLKGDVLIEAGFGSEVDNMEGLAVSKGRRGETVLTLISDDNFNSGWQRTVLLQFAIDDAANKNAGTAP